MATSAAEHQSLNGVDQRGVDQSDTSDASLVPETGSSRDIRVTKVLELEPSWVRWFYKNDNEKKWNILCGQDSLNLETQYRTSGNESSSILIRGNMYVVDLSTRSCVPVYWADKEPFCKVMRGTWFYDSTWEPVDESVAERIEAEHLRAFQGEDLQEEIVDKKHPSTIHKLKLSDVSLSIEWKSNNIVYMYNDTRSSKLYRVVTSQIGLSTGFRLFRSYNKQAFASDKLPPVSHLVFVIHGIGQKNDPSIVHSCNKFRQACHKIKGSHFRDLELDDQRVEFLPVDWRMSGNFNEDVVASVTPRKMHKLRTLFNSTALDILYYSSPMYKNLIIDKLKVELNRLYAMFCENNPDFKPNKGKVSLFCHSLGSVIMYDILSKWNPVQVYNEFMASMKTDCFGQLFEDNQQLSVELDQARKKVQQLERHLLDLHYQPVHYHLPFEVEFFFCVGSPLAVFLAMRGIQPPTAVDHIMLKTEIRRICNIFHPADPVAYRLEPLIHNYFSSVMPLNIYRYDYLYNNDYNAMERQMYPPRKHSADGKKDKKLSSPESDGKLINEMEKVKVAFKAGSVAAEIESPVESDADDTEYEVLDSSAADEAAASMEPPNIDYRIDFQLVERKMEFQFISALTSHTGYWSNSDVALFVMTQLFPDYLHTKA